MVKTNMNYIVDYASISLDKDCSTIYASSDYTFKVKTCKDILPVIDKLTKLEDLLNISNFKNGLITNKELNLTDSEHSYNYEVSDSNFEVQTSIILTPSLDSYKKYDLSFSFNKNVSNLKEINLFNNKFIAYNLMVLNYDLRKFDQYMTNLSFLKTVFDTLVENKKNITYANKMFNDAFIRASISSIVANTN